MAPSEGIEPPVEEPESSVLSITPRGHILDYELYIHSIHFLLNKGPFLLYKTMGLYFNLENQSLYLTILD